MMEANVMVQKRPAKELATKDLRREEWGVRLEVNY